MASNQIYDRSLQLDQLAGQQKQNSIQNALREAEFRKRYEMEQQQMRNQQSQQGVDNAFRREQLDLQRQIATAPKEKSFNLAEQLYGKMQSGNTSPEVLKGLGMYVDPNASAPSQISPYQLANLGISQEKLDLDKQTKQATMQKSIDAKKNATANLIGSAQTGLSIIEQIEKDGGLRKFGLTGGLPSIPGTSRVNWEANVDRLLTKQVLDVMSSLKSASATGSTGFGQLSEKELKLLQNASTSLRRTSNPKDAKRYLDEMKSAFNKILSEQKQEQTPSFEQGGQPQMPQTPQMANNNDPRALYNQLRAQGMSPEEARQQVGL